MLYLRCCLSDCGFFGFPDFIASPQDGGLSRRAAAARFGVGAASAIRCVREWRETGTTCAKPQGGDRRSHRIEGYRDASLAAIENQTDITLAEMAKMPRASLLAVMPAHTRNFQQSRPGR